MWQRWNQTTHIFEKSDNDGTTWVPLPLSGAVITEGTLPGVAYVNRANIFTQPINTNSTFVADSLNVAHAMYLDDGNAHMYWRNSNANVEDRTWRAIAWSNTLELRFEVINSGYGVLATPLSLHRNGAIAIASEIAFPATHIESGNPNSLDEYEEGYFYPTMVSDTGGAGTVYTEQTGRYTRIGNICVMQFSVVLQAANWGGGNVQMAGLPFTNGPTYATGYLDYWTININAYSLQLHWQPITAVLYVFKKTAISTTATQGTLLAAEVMPGVQFRGTIITRLN